MFFYYQFFVIVSLYSIVSHHLHVDAISQFKYTFSP